MSSVNSVHLSYPLSYPHDNTSTLRYTGLTYGVVKAPVRAIHIGLRFDTYSGKTVMGRDSDTPTTRSISAVLWGSVDDIGLTTWYLSREYDSFLSERRLEGKGWHFRLPDFGDFPQAMFYYIHAWRQAVFAGNALKDDWVTSLDALRTGEALPYLNPQLVERDRDGYTLQLEPNDTKVVYAIVRALRLANPRVVDTHGNSVEAKKLLKGY